ncbi:MAG: glycosyltransferase [Bacteroidetes bacterium]|nr:glycosyltransferase [Bacteroidota bacterium]
MSKKLAIIIVNWNSYDLTHDTLLSLSKTTYTNYDIIVVDNCSEDGSGEKLKKNFSKIILLASAKNNGFTGGNNIGMQYAIEQAYENVLLLNNDVAVAPNFIEPLLQV